MRVVFFSTTILEHAGGFEKYLIATARYLAGLPDCKVDIITLDEAFNKRLTRLLSLYYIKNILPTDHYKESFESVLTKLGEAKYKKCSLKCLKNDLRKYDLIYSKNELLEAFILKFFLGYKDIPPVVFSCGTPIRYPVAQSQHARLHNYLYNSWVYKFLASGVKAFHAKNSLDEKYLKIIFPNKMVVNIPNPVDVNQLYENARMYPFPYSFNNSKFNIAWVGRLTEQKGIDDLVKIINILNRTDDKEKIVWNICGDGESRGKIKSLVKKWDNVRHFGHIEHKYIPNFLQKNELFISTSHWEGSPNNVLEAQAVGLPVVAYEIDGCKDIITHGYNGYLVNTIRDFTDKLLDLVHNNKMGENFRDFITEKFDQKKIYTDLLNLLNYVHKRRTH